jgi:hypothetical protein
MRLSPPTVLQRQRIEGWKSTAWRFRQFRHIPYCNSHAETRRRFGGEKPGKDGRSAQGSGARSSKTGGAGPPAGAAGAAGPGSAAPDAHRAVRAGGQEELSLGVRRDAAHRAAVRGEAFHQVGVYQLPVADAAWRGGLGCSCVAWRAVGTWVSCVGWCWAARTWRCVCLSAVILAGVCWRRPQHPCPHRGVLLQAAGRTRGGQQAAPPAAPAVETRCQQGRSPHASKPLPNARPQKGAPAHRPRWRPRQRHRRA